MLQSSNVFGQISRIIFQTLGIRNPMPPMGTPLILYAYPRNLIRPFKCQVNQYKTNSNIGYKTMISYGRNKP